MDEELRPLRTEVAGVHGRLDASDERVNGRVDAVGARIDTLHRTAVQMGEAYSRLS